jgi:phosphoribosyl 1,2-cyclic phosphodiesterase
VFLTHAHLDHVAGRLFAAADATEPDASLPHLLPGGHDHDRPS